MSATARFEHTFIVRTWREEREEGCAQWRGSVEHVATKERRYFRDFADLSAFIAARQSATPRT
jgi:hypothetical protein